MKNDVNPSIDPYEQIKLWVSGKSVHDFQGICCPDYSCCYPEFKADADVRERFMRAIDTEDSGTVSMMVENFNLRKAISEGVNLHYMFKRTFH